MSQTTFDQFMSHTKPVDTSEKPDENKPKGFSEIMENATLTSDSQTSVFGEGPVVTDPATGDYSINPVDVTPYISIAQDPIIKKLLKTKEGVEDFKNNLTGYAVMMDNGLHSKVLPFPPQLKTVEEKVKWLDQNNARQIFFENSTS